MIKFSKFLSNLSEFEIQYKLDKKYPTEKDEKLNWKAEILVIFSLDGAYYFNVQIFHCIL